MNLSFGAVGRAVTAAICVSALSGCAETELGAHFIKSAARTAESAPPPAAAPTPPPTPDRFETTGLTIWDGAATLEGVWIAHPRAKRAQRVRVRNTQTGRETESAMFPRDAETPGPSILISSEAAHTLGVTPGEPTEIAITAIGGAEAPIDLLDEASARPIEAAAPEAPIEATQIAAASPAPSAVPPTARRSADAPTPPLPRPTLEAPAQKTAALDTRAPAPRARPGRAAAPPSDGAYLQVGVFKIEANAAALAERLRARGQPAHRIRGGAGAENINIILIGPLADGEIAAARAAAEAEGVVDAIEVTP
ncbi:SPOR domain-containing protein [Pikeienuella sp. HZG-20]|uniref:SPOR domain-containing protein n=1 Tax=Paludibacillus litoralis TaxID=3133267 RepID=UPI0030EF5A9F